MTTTSTKHFECLDCGNTFPVSAYAAKHWVRDGVTCPRCGSTETDPADDYAARVAADAARAEADRERGLPCMGCGAYGCNGHCME